MTLATTARARVSGEACPPISSPPAPGASTTPRPQPRPMPAPHQARRPGASPGPCVGGNGATEPKTRRTAPASPWRRRSGLLSCCRRPCTLAVDQRQSEMRVVPAVVTPQRSLRALQRRGMAEGVVAAITVAGQPMGDREAFGLFAVHRHSSVGVVGSGAPKRFRPFGRRQCRDIHDVGRRHLEIEAGFSSGAKDFQRGGLFRGITGGTVGSAGHCLGVFEGEVFGVPCGVEVGHLRVPLLITQTYAYRANM